MNKQQKNKKGWQLYQEKLCKHKWYLPFINEKKVKCSLCDYEYKSIEKRLKYLKREIEKERISYGEIAELQGLKQYIDKNDTLLLEWAGVDETRCHSCGSIEKNHYCTNESCYEFTKYED